MLTDPLAPQPMTPAEVADLVERVRRSESAARRRGGCRFTSETARAAVQRREELRRSR